MKRTYRQNRTYMRPYMRDYQREARAWDLLVRLSRRLGCLPEVIELGVRLQRPSRQKLMDEMVAKIHAQMLGGAGDSPKPPSA